MNVEPRTVISLVEFPANDIDKDGCDDKERLRLTTADQLPLDDSSPQWHPMVTPYRLLLTTLGISFGVLNALLDDLHGAITILECFLVIVAAVVLRWLNAEANYTSWFFEFDCAHCILVHSTTSAVHYRTDERTKFERPRLSGYRILVFTALVLFSIIQVPLCSAGIEVGQTVVWLLATVFGVGLYWLGKYEPSSTQVMPSLFETDYASSVSSALFQIGHILMLLLAGLVGFAFSASWSIIWIYGLVQLWQNNFSDDSGSGWGMKIFLWAFSILWTAGALVAIGIGLTGCIYIIFLGWATLKEKLPVTFTSGWGDVLSKARELVLQRRYGKYTKLGSVEDSLA